MPELPEVETIKLGLSQLLPGKKILKVWHDWEKSFPNADADVDRFLVGAEITRVRRRAKVLIIDLSSKYSLAIHLKMTGQLVYVGTQESLVTSPQSPGKTDDKRQQTADYALPAEERFGAGHPSDSLIGQLPDKSTRVIFDLQTVKGRTLHAQSRLFFNDQRKFGWIRLIPTSEVENLDFFKHVGPEPLSSNFTQAEFRNRLKRRANTNIKAALLDQTVLAGIGNIYADESLWNARIYPATLVKNISDNKLNTLFTAIINVLTLSIEKGGSTDRNYVNAEGQKGSYLSFANVFRRNGLPCPRCGEVILKMRVAGRGTHVCPKCQKLTQ